MLQRLCLWFLAESFCLNSDEVASVDLTGAHAGVVTPGTTTFSPTSTQPSYVSWATNEVTAWDPEASPTYYAHADWLYDDTSIGISEDEAAGPMYTFGSFECPEPYVSISRLQERDNIVTKIICCPPSFTYRTGSTCSRVATVGEILTIGKQDVPSDREVTTLKEELDIIATAITGYEFAPKPPARETAWTTKPSVTVTPASNATDSNSIIEIFTDDIFLLAVVGIGTLLSTVFYMIICLKRPVPLRENQNRVAKFDRRIYTKRGRVEMGRETKDMDYSDYEREWKRRISNDRVVIKKGRVSDEDGDVSGGVEMHEKENRGRTRGRVERKGYRLQRRALIE